MPAVDVQFSGPGVRQISPGLFQVTEGDGQAFLSIDRTPTGIFDIIFGSSENTGYSVSATADANDITPLPGSNGIFSLSGGSVALPAGGGISNLSIGINNDGVKEGTETITVTLLPPPGDAIGPGVGQATLQILDSEVCFDTSPINLELAIGELVDTDGDGRLRC